MGLFNGKTLKWWFIFSLMSAVACTVAGGLAGLVVGFFIGFFGTIGGMRDMIKPAVGVVCPIAGVLVSLPISYLCFSFSVRNLLKEVQQ